MRVEIFKALEGHFSFLDSEEDTMLVRGLILLLELESCVLDIPVHQDCCKRVVVVCGCENLDLITLSLTLRLELRVLKKLELELEGLWCWLFLLNHLHVKLGVFLVVFPEIGCHIYFLSRGSFLSGRSILSWLVRSPLWSILLLSTKAFVASFLSFDILGVSTSLSVAIA